MLPLGGLRLFSAAVAPSNGNHLGLGQIETRPTQQGFLEIERDEILRTKSDADRSLNADASREKPGRGVTLRPWCFWRAFCAT